MDGNILERTVNRELGQLLLVSPSLPKACGLLQLLMSLTCWRKDQEEN